MTRSDRLKTALAALVDERREEIDALRRVRAIAVTLTFDEAGCVDFEEVRYESGRQKHRTSKDRSHVT